MMAMGGRRRVAGGRGVGRTDPLVVGDCQSEVWAFKQVANLALALPALQCRRMWTDPRFSGAAATRWAELRAGPWSDAAINTLIGDTSAQVSAWLGWLPACGPMSALGWHLVRPIMERLAMRAQIKPAVLRNFQRYASVILKPWYTDAEQEWTTGAAMCAAAVFCRLADPALECLLEGVENGGQCLSVRTHGGRTHTRI